MDERKKIVIKLNPLRELPVIGVRILEKKYAEQFVKDGIIHFSSPSEWRNEEGKKGLQLDKYEGCFCFSSEDNSIQLSKERRNFTKEESEDGYRYYEETSDVVACCFYGVLKSNFKKENVKYGVKNVEALNIIVPLSFFDSFNCESKEERSVIIIFDFPRIIEKITLKLIELGCKREDIHFSLVYYVNKSIPFYSNEPFPFEFFLKDLSFRDQSEFRFLIVCKDQSIKKVLEESNYNVCIGDISGIATCQDYYNSNLIFSIQHDKLIYSLAKSFTSNISDSSFSELVGILYQALQNQLPGEPKSQEDIQKYVSFISGELHRRFSVKYCDDWRLENVPYSEYLTLPTIFQGMCRSLNMER